MQATGRRRHRQVPTRYWREEDARSALEKQGRSGLSIGVFAEQNGIRVQRLLRWQRRLDGARRRPTLRRSLISLPAVRTSGAVVTEGGVRLIPAVAVGPAGRRGEGAAVVLRMDGVVVEVADAAAVPAPWIASLIAGVRRDGR
jgi:hypothetical protein